MLLPPPQKYHHFSFSFTLWDTEYITQFRLLTTTTKKREQIHHRCFICQYPVIKWTPFIVHQFCCCCKQINQIIIITYLYTPRSLSLFFTSVLFTQILLMFGNSYNFIVCVRVFLCEWKWFLLEFPSARGLTSLSQNAWLPARHPEVQARTRETSLKLAPKCRHWDGMEAGRIAGLRLIRWVVLCPCVWPWARVEPCSVTCRGVSSRNTNSDTT